MMEKIRIKHIHSSLGDLIAGEYHGQLCLFDWKYRKMREQIDRRIQSGLNGYYVEEDCPLFSELEKQFSEYLHKKRQAFDLPYITVGSEFQKTVWNSLLKIKYGKKASYSDLAEIVGNPKAVRAVASANGANALSIIIPCHRIIASDGSLGGYAGGVPAKDMLLHLENQLQFQWD
jgi:methylated-DNA-[protein]-cysteine S-methyltransferase